MIFMGLELDDLNIPFNPNYFMTICTLTVHTLLDGGQIAQVVLSHFGQACCLIRLGPRARMGSQCWNQGELGICSRIISYP